MSAEAPTPQHGGQLHKIAERFGIPPTGLLDFSANINPEGPSPLAIDALHRALDHPATLTSYPDLEETQLRLAIATYAGVAPATIAVANGFVPLLDAALRVFPIRDCLMPVPAFSEYRKALERAGVSVTAYPLDPADGFRYQPGKLLAALRSGSHDAILLANPQNPTGILCNRSTLREFVSEAASLNVRVFLDEAFIDYAPIHSMVTEAGQLPNLVVFRSVTKFHGIPGLRVAYAVAQPSHIASIHNTLAPWSITTLAAIAVRATLADTTYAERAIKLNHERRIKFIQQLNSIGINTYPASANFLLLQFPSTTAAEVTWRQLIAAYGIVLRHCTNFEGLGHNHLRCAVRDSADNSRLIEALAHLQRPELENSSPNRGSRPTLSPPATDNPVN